MQEKDKACFGRIDHSNSSIKTQLLHAIAVMKAIDDLTFRKDIAGSTVGAQFRHVLDFVDLFLQGVKVGRIDFASRKRDARVEKDRAFAIAQFENAIDRVSELSDASRTMMVSVRSETDPRNWFVSSVGREVDYVTSHTVHHFALIAQKLSSCGINCANSFGLAQSTLDYRQRLAA